MLQESENCEPEKRKRKKSQDVPDLSHPSTWKNRRRMAWISLCVVILLTAILLFAPEEMVRDKRIEILSDVLSWVYLGLVSVIGAYMGFTTYASVKGKRDSYRSDDDAL